VIVVPFGDFACTAATVQSVVDAADSIRAVVVANAPAIVALAVSPHARTPAFLFIMSGNLPHFRL
jgi:hypothetical protein